MKKPRIGEGGPTDRSMLSGHARQREALDRAPGGIKTGPRFEASSDGESRAENVFFSLPHRRRRYGMPDETDWDEAEAIYRDFSIANLRWAEERLAGKAAPDAWDEMDLSVIRSEIGLRAS